MRIVFGKIFSNNPDKYLREKLKRIVSRYPGLAAQSDDTWIQAKVGSILGNLGKTSVAIAQADSFYPVTPDQEAEIEARKRCTIFTLLRDSPLTPDETIEEDFFTFLKEPFGGSPAGTVVLRRITSGAEIFYLFEDVQVVKGDLQYIQRAPFEPEPQVSALIDPDTVKGIAKTLGEGFADWIRGLRGRSYFRQDLPSGYSRLFRRSIQRD